MHNEHNIEMILKRLFELSRLYADTGLAPNAPGSAAKPIPPTRDEILDKHHALLVANSA
jgi:hypothetical protein